jgi:hypothetical protein
VWEAPAGRTGGKPAEPDVLSRRGSTRDGTPWVCFDAGGDWLAAAQQTRGGWVVALVSRRAPYPVRILERGLAQAAAIGRAGIIARALFHAGAAELVLMDGE